MEKTGDGTLQKIIISRADPLGNIKSTYIINNIFDYIRDINFKLTFFKYSKKFQNKLKLKLYDYQKKYLDQINFNVYDYISIQFLQLYPKYYDFDYLTNKFKNDSLKYEISIDNFQKYIIDFYQNYSLKEDESIGKRISIFSPIFDILSKSEFFSEKFSFYINPYYIEFLNIKEKYITIFSKLDELKSNYSIYYEGYKNKNTINYLKELGIDFNKINKICFLHYEPVDSGNDEKFLDSNSFFTSLFALKNLGKNLIFLSLELSLIRNNIDIIILENLNHLDLLEELKLINFKFSEKFILNLKNLKKLFVECCRNFTFSQNMCLNLTLINIDASMISKNNNILKFPKLEKLRISKGSIDDIINLNSIIDFNSLINLKILDIDIGNFMHINNSILLEDLKIYCPIEFIDLNFEAFCEMKINAIKKILLLKNLKVVYLDSDYVLDEEKSKISCTNDSIKKLIFLNTSYDLKLNDLLFKFPNLSELDLDSPIFSTLDSYKIELKENSYSKLNKIKLILRYRVNIEITCQPFENLEIFNLSVKFGISNIKDVFPIFNSECKKILKNLITFNFIQVQEEINLEVLYNIYNNLDKMCNLKHFGLNCIQRNIEENFHKKFIKKLLLSLRLDSISFYIRKNQLGECYSEKELKEIYPDFNIKKFRKNKIHISKLI